MHMWLHHCLQLQLPMRMSAEFKLYCITSQCCPSRFDTVEWLMHWRMCLKHAWHACLLCWSSMLCTGRFVLQACSQ